MKAPTASIIAIGTEITSGQTKNSHATFISSELDDFGISTDFHLAVPDDHDLMIQALEIASKKSRYLIVTGGLGPTRDDFTRNIVAEFLNAPLVLDESSWIEIQERLTARNVRLSPGHKNQCHFPKGAKILRNDAGTAHGFFVETATNLLWVLPGPTPEMQFVWKNSVRYQFKTLTPQRSSELVKWTCLGAPESELADLTEATLEGSGLQTGYRLTSPFVEVKVWIPSEWSAAERQKWLDPLEKSLSPWIHARGKHDFAKDFLDHTLTKGPLTIIDDVSLGQMHERLMSIFREHKSSYPFELRFLTSTLPELEGISFAGSGSTLRLISTPKKGEWQLELSFGGQTEKTLMSFEVTARTNPERLGKVATEMALRTAAQWIQAASTTN